MEKYGVELDREKVAEAEETQTCPRCKRALLFCVADSKLHCPECGTEPFEKTGEKDAS
jgi:ribosomal protein S27AE